MMHERPNLGAFSWFLTLAEVGIVLYFVVRILGVA